MLTESEVKAEIKLLLDKIDQFEKEIKPFTELEEQILNKFHRIGSPLTFKVVIPVKSSKEAMIKSWKQELKIYKRILDGKKMDPLKGREISERQMEKAKEISKNIEEI